MAGGAQRGPAGGSGTGCSGSMEMISVELLQAAAALSAVGERGGEHRLVIADHSQTLPVVAVAARGSGGAEGGGEW